MTLEERTRIRFHEWLVAHRVDADLAGAILTALPPSTGTSS